MKEFFKICFIGGGVGGRGGGGGGEGADKKKCFENGGREEFIEEDGFKQGNGACCSSMFCVS